MDIKNETKKKLHRRWCVRMSPSTPRLRQPLPLLTPHPVDDLEHLRDAAHDGLVDPQRPVPVLDLVRVPPDTLGLERGEEEVWRRGVVFSRFGISWGRRRRMAHKLLDRLAGDVFPFSGLNGPEDAVAE